MPSVRAAAPYQPDNWKSAGGERGLRGPAAIGQARRKIGTPSAGIGFAHLGPEAATRVPKRNCPAITGSTRLPNMPPRFEINVTGRARRGRLSPTLAYLPGGLYAPRSLAAVCRTWLTSSCVIRRVRVTFWTAPAATAMPEIAAAASGLGTS